MFSKLFAYNVLYQLLLCSLEKKLVDLEASAVESHAGEATASRGTSSVSLPRISSAQVRPVSRDSGTVNVESSSELSFISLAS